MSDVNAVTTQKPRRWPLYASLFLNVVLITVLAIGAWRIHQARDAFGAGLGAWLPRQIERVLPDETAARVKAIRERHAAEFKPLFENARAARDAVRKALDSEPFDQAGLKTALAAMREADAAVAEKTADVIVEIAATLSPAERQLVREKAKELRMRPGKGPRGAGRERGELPPPPEGPMGEPVPPPPDGEEPPPPPPGGP